MYICDDLYISMKKIQQLEKLTKFGDDFLDSGGGASTNNEESLLELIFSFCI